MDSSAEELFGISTAVNLGTGYPVPLDGILYANSHTPEPSSLAVLLLTGFGAAFMRRFKK